MNPEFKISNYYHTKFIKILINGSSAGNIDVLYSFAGNKFYNCEACIAPLGGFVFLTFNNGMKTFECEACDELISIDNEKFSHNDIFYNVSRIKLPSFELILQDDTVVDVQAFLSVYKNGFSGITYAYKNVNKLVEKSNLKRTVQWGNVEYIKLPQEVCDILNLEVVNANSESIVVDIFEFMEPYSTIFDFMISVVLKIINNDQNNRRIEFYSIKQSECFAYFQLETDARQQDIDTSDLIKLFEGSGNNYLDAGLREDICNLSYNDGTTYLLTQRFLLGINHDKHSNDRIINLFHNIDYLLNEKNKLYDALERVVKMESHPELLEADIIRQFNDNYLEILKNNFVYDFSLSGEYKLILKIKKVLKNDIIMDELERIFNRYQNKSVLVTEKKEKEKELLEKEKEKDTIKKEKDINHIIQFLAMLFSIPAVSDVVDIFYSIDVKNPIIFNIGMAKLLFTMVTSLSILCFFSRIINFGKNKMD